MKGRQRIWLILIMALCFLLGNTSITQAEESHSLQFFYENVCASCDESEKFYELFNRCISPEEKKGFLTKSVPIIFFWKQTEKYMRVF